VARLMLLHGVAEEVGYGDEAAGFFAYFPDVAVGVKGGDHFAELGGGVGAEAGDYTVVTEDEGNNGEDVGPEETGKAERANEGRGNEAAEENEGVLRNGDWMAASGFENSDALAIVDGILQNADGLRLGKVMEGTKNRAESHELGGDFGGVNGFRPVCDRSVGLLLNALEGGRVWVQIRKANFGEAALAITQGFAQPGPRAAAAGT